MIAILMGSSHAAVAICCVYTNHSCTQIMDISNHRRRIKIEEKAKYVGSVWGGRIYSIPYRASCFELHGRFELQDELHQDDLKEKDEFILCSSKLS